MVRRDYEKIWKGLYEFPCIETDESEASVNNTELQFPSDFSFDRAQPVFRTNHVLTHRFIRASFFEIVYSKKVPARWIKVRVSEAHSMPVHRLIQEYLEQMHDPKKQ